MSTIHERRRQWIGRELQDLNGLVETFVPVGLTDRSMHRFQLLGELLHFEVMRMAFLLIGIELQTLANVPEGRRIRIVSLVRVRCLRETIVSVTHGIQQLTDAKVRARVVGDELGCCFQITHGLR